MTPTQAELDRFGVRDPELIAETGIAKVWHVRQKDGTPAALKLYKDGDEKDEAPGLTLLAALNGTAAVRILGRAPGAVLMEYLSGQSLGDMARAGDDLEATAHLAAVAKDIATAKVPATGLTNLDDRCDTLFAAQTADPALGQAQSLARQLLATAPVPSALHGDLHHDNILRGDRGWCVIDPKGIWGDPAYEYANAFRNPVGFDPAFRDADRLRAMLDCFARVSGLPKDRLMGWAAVHVCMSILWDRDRSFDSHPDRDLPPLYLALAEAT